MADTWHPRVWTHLHPSVGLRHASRRPATLGIQATLGAIAAHCVDHRQEQLSVWAEPQADNLLELTQTFVEGDELQE
jgi:hypothetical protein